MPAPMPPSGGPPKDYMVLSIVATVLGVITCTCVPLITGIIAIVFSNKARQAYAAGDFATAESSANTAKILVIVSFAILAVLTVVNIIFFTTGWYSNFTTG